MRQKLTNIDNGNSRLVLLFAGWATDAALYPIPGVEGYDMMVVWDYSDTTIDISLLNRYSEIIVIGYSFGVPAAARFMQENTHLPITARIAVNGTCFPVDDDMGIPRNIFEGTIAGLSDITLNKFYRRMAGSATAFDSIGSLLPTSPDIENLKHQLNAIDRRDNETADWDMSFISKRDMIIPTRNQVRAWEAANVPIHMIEEAHFPDFNALFRTILTDKDLVSRQFYRAISTYDDAASIQRRIVSTLVDLWNPSASDHPDMLEIGCGTGMSTRIFLERVTPDSLRLWDLSPAVTSLPQADEIKAIDGEIAIAQLEPESLDIIFTTSTIQWFNSPAMFLQRSCKALRKGGKIILSTFGPTTFAILHEITGIHTTYLSPVHLRALVPDGMTVSVLEDEEITISFDSITDLMHHIKATGVNALPTGGNVSAARRILRNYPRDPEGHVSLIYNPIYLILTKL